MFYVIRHSQRFSFIILKNFDKHDLGTGALNKFTKYQNWSQLLGFYSKRKIYLLLTGDFSDRTTHATDDFFEQ